VLAERRRILGEGDLAGHGQPCRHASSNAALRHALSPGLADGHQHRVGVDAAAASW